MRLATAGRGALFLTVSAMGVSFLTQVWLGRRFGPTGLGEYNATTLFVIVLSAVLLFGAPFALSQLVAVADERRDPSAAALLGTALTAFLALALVAALVGLWLWSPYSAAVSLARPAPAAAVALASGAAVVHAYAVSVLLARLRMAAVTAIVVLQPLAVAAGLLLERAGAGIEPSTLAAAGYWGAGAGALGAVVRQGVRPGLALSRAAELFRASVGATTVLYMTLLTTSLDRLIIGLIVGPAALGAFAAAASFTEGLLRLARSVGVFGVAAYARLSDDRVGLRRVLDSHIRIMSALFIVAAAFILAAGRSVLATIFGGDFAIATTTFSLLAVALLPMGISLALASRAVGGGEHGRSARTLAIIVPLQIVLGILGTAALSIAGTALAMLVVWSLALAMYAAQAWRDGQRSVVHAIARIAGTSAPVFLIAFIVGRQDLAWPVQAAVALTAAVPAVVVLIFDQGERRILRRLVGRS